MKPAVIVVDMIEDFIRLDGPLPVGEEGLKIVPNINKLITACHEKGILTVFSNDALKPDDFLFNSRMKPHAIKDTPGTHVFTGLNVGASDLVVDKPRFSAFFGTDLCVTLKERGIDTLIVCGVATEICVLSTAYDGVCNDFRVIVLQDCCASRFPNTHQEIMAILKLSPLYPLLKVTTLDDFLVELG